MTVRFRSTHALFFFLFVMVCPALARADSTRGPVYVQASPLALSSYSIECNNCVFWAPEIEVGFHFSGRSDGPSLGFRQTFFIGGAGGRTAGGIVEALRVGFWDIPIRIGESLELGISPFGVIGINDVFEYGAAGVHFGFGVDGRLFFLKGLYAWVRPLEMGGANYVDLGRVYFHYKTAAGIGIAF